MPSRDKIVAGAVILVMLSTAGSVIIAGLAWNQIHESADRFAAVGDALAAATLLLSALGASIALAAYLASTETPRLEPEIVFRCSEPNQPVFLVDADVLSRKLELVSFRQVESSIRIHNRRWTSAHNPALRIDLVGMGGLRAQPHWRPVDWANPYGVCAVQWDGGTQYAIHGNGTRVLPSLTLAGVVALPGDEEPALLVTVVADGFGQGWTLPVELMEREEYLRYSTQRADRHLTQLALVEACAFDDCERPAVRRVLVFPEHAAPKDAAVCAQCAEGREVFHATPSLLIVDNLDLRHERHDAIGRHVVTSRSGLGPPRNPTVPRA